MIKNSAKKFPILSLTILIIFTISLVFLDKSDHFRYAPGNIRKINLYEITDKLKNIYESKLKINYSNISQYSQILKNDSNSQNKQSFSKKQIEKMSNMARRLFLFEDKWPVAKRNFTILMYNHGKHLEKRFLRSYGKVDKNPWEHCSVSNCKITNEPKDFNKSDLVVFWLKGEKNPFYKMKRSFPEQIWAWFLDEPPMFLPVSPVDPQYQNVFNWSVNYRLDSEVVVAHGRTVPLKPEETPSIDYKNIFKSKNRTVAALISHCSTPNKRLEYIKRFKKHINLHFYGSCGNMRCPGYMQNDCKVLEKYKFFLAFENSNCEDYISEKVRQFCNFC